MSIFDDRYRNDETGRKAIDPKVLIKIVLFGYSLGLIINGGYKGVNWLNTPHQLPKDRKDSESNREEP